MWNSQPPPPPPHAAAATDDPQAPAQHPPPPGSTLTATSAAAPPPQHDPRLASLAAAYQPSYLSTSASAAAAHHHAAAATSTDPHAAAPPPPPPPPPPPSEYDPYRYRPYTAPQVYPWEMEQHPWQHERQQAHLATTAPPPPPPPTANGDAPHLHAHPPQRPPTTKRTASSSSSSSALKPPPPSATAAAADHESTPPASQTVVVAAPQPRGKPEAMAKSLAAARLKAQQEEELENERQAAAAARRARQEAEAFSDEELPGTAMAAAPKPTKKKKKKKPAPKQQQLQQQQQQFDPAVHKNEDGDEDHDADDDEVVAEPIAAEEAVEGDVLVHATAAAAAPPPPKKTSAKRSRSKSPKKTATGSSSTSTPRKRGGANSSAAKSSGSKARGAGAASAVDVGLLASTTSLFSQPAHAITNAEYENLQALMVQFCRVPLLAEFSRPVSLLHPELSAAYSKIVSHAVDLGHVCRGIRRRQYQNTRDIRLDMWRVFANCVKFHSHPNNKEAVPSFVSIALHLREFFNNLWQEYMMPSDLPATTNPCSSATKEQLQIAFEKRQQERRRNLENSGVLVLNEKITTKTAKLIGMFLDKGGCTDGLDNVPLFGPNATASSGAAADPDIDVVVANLRQLEQRLAAMTEEYTVDSFHRDLVATYSQDVLEDNLALRHLFANRLNRLFWKLLIPLHEANSRGVTQSSIWGNIAATIWARESSKKAYWPALCLGILPPEDQREGWHDAVTERNEARLPEKLRMQLETAKKKCLQAQKRQSLSYFLVEFLGTHEFIWVRETDIVENFDPDNDPNKKAVNAASSLKKSKRASRSGVATVVNSRMYATALEECVWANEEYESVLQDAFDCHDSEDEGDAENAADMDGEEMNYSYSILSQSDDEADDEDKHHFTYDANSMSMSDIDEANWLFEHEGLLDLSAAGRKNAKKRAQMMKKKAAMKERKTQKAAAAAAAPSEQAANANSKTSSSKSKAESASAAAAKKKAAKQKDKVLREQKKEQKELEKRRKKRMREREKALRSEAKKQNKRRRVADGSSVAGGGDEDDERAGSLAHDKRARASAIVKAYLTRMANDDDYNKSLGLGGVMAIPAAMVDSTGLLGMALAFRAAAGEISMPDESAEQQQMAKLKPWTAVDTARGKTSAERTVALEKQSKLLQAQLDRVRANTQRRKDMAREAIAQRLRVESEIEADEDAARRNHFKKKKKYPVKTAAASAKPAAAASGKLAAAASAENGNAKEEEEEDEEEENGGIINAEPVDDDDDHEDAQEPATAMEVEPVVAEAVAAE